MLKTTEDLLYQMFGTFIVTKFEGYQPLHMGGTRRFAHYECQCSCGNQYILSARTIKKLDAPILDQTCSCQQLSYCNLSGVQVQHLQKRQKSVFMNDLLFDEFCHLSFAPCDCCHRKATYDDLNKLKRVKTGEKYIPYCPKCYVKGC